MQEHKGSPLAEETREKLRVFDDPKFVFEPVEHVYTYEGRPMTGSTTYLKRFHSDFDEIGMSISSGLKKGVDPAELRAQWKVTRDRACDLGTWVHEGIEDWWRDAPRKDHHDDEVNYRMMMFEDYAQRHLAMLEPVVLEQRLFNARWGLAGTMDALFLLGDTLIVGDWKTNGKFKTDKDYNFGKKMFYPFQDLKENDLNKYSIQMALYRCMLAEAGVETHSAFLCHIGKDGTITVHRALDLTRRMRAYLDNENPLEATLF
jgi:hypothetical protein